MLLFRYRFPDPLCTMAPTLQQSSVMQNTGHMGQQQQLGRQPCCWCQCLCVTQVVEQARDIVVKDTQLETAIVGEDILLTPRSPDAQPDAQSDALLAAGDHTSSLTLQTLLYFNGCLSLGCPQPCLAKACWAAPLPPNTAANVCSPAVSSSAPAAQQHKSWCTPFVVHQCIPFVQQCAAGCAICCTASYTVHNSRRLQRGISLLFCVFFVSGGGENGLQF